MSLLPLKFAASAPTRDEIEGQSEYCWKCWINRDEWIERKVDQVEYLDKTTIARTLIYDINFSRLHQLELGFSDEYDPESARSRESRTRYILPLDVLSHRPYMTLSLDSPWDYRSCLASSRERNWYLTMLLFGFLMSIGVKFDKLTDAVIQNVVIGIRPGADGETIKAVLNDMCLAVSRESDRRTILGMRETVEWLRESAFVLVVVPREESIDRCTISFSFNDAHDDLEKSPSDRWTDRFRFFLEKWGIAASSITVSNANLDDDLSLHLRVQIPEGMRVDNVYFELTSSDLDEDEKAYVGRISSRWNGKVVTASAPEPPPRVPFNLRIVMNPKRLTLAFPALAVSFMAFIIAELTIYWILGFPFECHELLDAGCAVQKPTFPNQSIAPMTALIPSFVASYVLVSQEHERLSFALGFRRTILAVGAVSSVLFSVIIAFGMSDGVAGVKITWTLLIYAFIQIALLAFFLFDIIRVEFWRRKKVASMRKGVWNLRVIGFGLVAVGLALTCWNASLLLGISIKVSMSLLAVFVVVATCGSFVFIAHEDKRIEENRITVLGLQ
jgi:hypothetical protein